MSVDLDSFPDAAWVPVLYAGDEFGLVPVDGVVFGVGVLDDRGLFYVALSAMGSVFIKSGREVPASLADWHQGVPHNPPEDATSADLPQGPPRPPSQTR